MARRGRTRRLLPLVAIGGALALAASNLAGAQKDGISLARTPAPPQAIQVGSGSEKLDWTVNFGSTPDRVVTSILARGATTPFQLDTTPITGQPSPQAGSFSFAPPGGSAVGRYTGKVEYFAIGDNLEASASVTFDVAAQLGRLVVIKYEDDNGNGVFDGGEPGLPGWRFAMINPEGNPSEVVTGTDGSSSLPGVPAGTWQAQEIVDPGWVPITPPGGAGTFEVPAGGTGTLAAGNARPAPISGTVYRDDNRNGARDPGEPGIGGVTLALGGTFGTGAAVPGAAMTSASDGTYLFGGNFPGAFQVSATVPPGLQGTSPTTLGDVVIRSNVGNANNDFGFAPEVPVAPAGAPRPDVRIGLSGPKSSRRGAVFSYTIVVRNRSEFVARDVKVTALVPKQLSLVRAPRGAVVRDGVVTWPVGNLGPGERRSLTIRVRVISAAPRTRVRNTATVEAEGLPPKRATTTTRLRPVTVNAGKLKPKAGGVLTTRRPTLRWVRHAGAQLYNVQIFALGGPDGRRVKILSSFPRRNVLRVPGGTLKFGKRYAWRVWPFLGRGRGFAANPVGVSYFDVQQPKLIAVLARRLISPTASKLAKPRKLTVRWKKRTGSRFYRVELKRGERVVFRETTRRLRTMIPAKRLRSKGDYTLIVRASRGTSRTEFHSVGWARGTFSRT